MGLNYDSLLAKVIASGAHRDEALARLRSGLDRLTVLGPATNRAFLIDALATLAFTEGRATTQLIGEYWPDGWTPDPDDVALARRIAALAAWFGETPPTATGSPWSRRSGFRLLGASGRSAKASFSIARDGAATEVTVLVEAGSFILSDEDGETRVAAKWSDGTLDLVIDGALLRCPVRIGGSRVALRARSVEAVFEVVPAADAALTAASAGGGHTGTDVIAPMPGLVAEIAVALGDQVRPGQTVAVLESMKLFTDLKAAVAGRVAAIGAERGMTVSAGALIVAVEPDNQES